MIAVPTEPMTEGTAASSRQLSSTTPRACLREHDCDATPVAQQTRGEEQLQRRDVTLRAGLPRRLSAFPPVSTVAGLSDLDHMVG